MKRQSNKEASTGPRIKITQRRKNWADKDRAFLDELLKRILQLDLNCQSYEVALLFSRALTIQTEIASRYQIDAKMKLAAEAEIRAKGFKLDESAIGIVWDRERTSIAAKAAGVDETTIRRWRKMQEYQSAVMQSFGCFIAQENRARSPRRRAPIPTIPSSEERRNLYRPDKVAILRSEISKSWAGPTVLPLDGKTYAKIEEYAEAAQQAAENMAQEEAKKQGQSEEAQKAAKNMAQASLLKSNNDEH